MSDTNEASVKDAAPAAKPSALPTLLGLVNTLLLAGVLAFLVVGRGASPAAEGDEKGQKGEGAEHGEKSEKGEKAARVGQMVKLADFTVHLRNPEADRYARVSFEVEVATDADREAVTAQMPKLRDAFISYLSDRTAEELRGSENLEHTKEALATQMAKLVPDVRTKGLYISDFVIQ